MRRWWACERWLAGGGALWGLGVGLQVGGGAGGRAYIFFNTARETTVAEDSAEIGCRQPLLSGMDRMDAKVPERYRDWRTGAADVMEMDVPQQADTLEELAQKLGLAPQTSSSQSRIAGTACSLP